MTLSTLRVQCKCKWNVKFAILSCIFIFTFVDMMKFDPTKWNVNFVSLSCIFIFTFVNMMKFDCFEVMNAVIARELCNTVCVQHSS